MYRRIVAGLSKLGYEWYEVSNFALPGHRCCHNSAVWRGRDYLGIGPAAVGTVAGVRQRDLPDLEAYLDAWSAAASRLASRRRSPSATRARERLLLAARTGERLPLAVARRRHRRGRPAGAGRRWIGLAHRWYTPSDAKGAVRGQRGLRAPVSRFFVSGGMSGSDTQTGAGPGSGGRGVHRLGLAGRIKTAVRVAVVRHRVVDHPQRPGGARGARPARSPAYLGRPRAHRCRLPVLRRCHRQGASRRARAAARPCHRAQRDRRGSRGDRRGPLAGHRAAGHRLGAVTCHDLHPPHRGAVVAAPRGDGRGDHHHAGT